MKIVGEESPRLNIVDARSPYDNAFKKLSLKRQKGRILMALYCYVGFLFSYIANTIVLMNCHNGFKFHLAILGISMSGVLCCIATNRLDDWRNERKWEKDREIL